MNLTRIPTAISHAEGRKLREFARDQNMVEAGALLGFSTLLMAETARHVISIDRHSNYGPPTLRTFLSNIQGNLNKITPITGEAEDYVGWFANCRYFLDLDGTYQTTLGVLEKIPIGSLV